MTFCVTHQPCVLNMSLCAGWGNAASVWAEAESLAGKEASLHNLHCLILVGGVSVLFF